VSEFLADPSALLPIAREPANPPAVTDNVPRMVAECGPAGAYAWNEFFLGQLRNPHTRATYKLAVMRFLGWLEAQAVALQQVTAGHVGAYFNQHNGSPATKNVHLAALRSFFDVLTVRHVLVLNPAHSVRGEKHVDVEGKTPEITTEQARTLLESIGTETTADLRDAAVIATLIYTAARVGAVAKLKLKHLIYDGSQYSLRFDEKNGKSREIPVQHKLEKRLKEYLEAAGLSSVLERPLFRTVAGKTGKLTGHAMTSVDICRMVKRRVRKAGLPEQLSPHSFRVLACTNLMTQGTLLEDVQYLLGHSDVRTTRLYNRRQKKVTRDIVERISV